MKEKLFVVTTFVLAFCNVILLIFPSYFVELVISFLPQILLVEFLLLIIIILFLQNNKLENLFSLIDKKVSLKIFACSILLIFLLTFAFLSIKFINFSFVGENISLNPSTKLKIVFFNKKYNNNNYGIISKAISELDPDIIAVAECEFDCQNKILALSTYKFSALSKGDPNFPVILLSKFELKNVTLTSDVDEVNAKVVIGDKEINLIAVHPLAPVLLRTYELRNTQLEKIANQINDSTSTYKIIFGDFNLSPWSNYYSKFLSNTVGIYDSAKGKGINTTWGATSFGNLVRTHIDHIFLSKNIKTDDFNVLNTYGSDHNMLVVDIAL